MVDGRKGKLLISVTFFGLTFDSKMIFQIYNL